MPQNSSSRNRKPDSGGKNTGARGSSGARGNTSTRPAARSGGRPANRAAGRPGGKSKSIVTKRQRPWGLIATSVIVVLFAAGVIGYAVSRGGKSNDGSNPYTRDEIVAAKAISGVTYKKEPDHNHVTAKVTFDSSPPVGGNHAQYWADCTGTVYTNQIASENAVHSLEHGAVWVTYRPGLAASEVALLAKQVTGVDRMLMSPYAGLTSAISLQSWGYQLFVDKADDPRIAAFIKALRFNPGTTPESAASCSSPNFKTTPSTPDKPTF